MNEKINSLRQEAWRYANNYVGDDIGVKSQLQRFEEKFAELIINECLDIVDKEVLGMVGVNAMKKIEEHFGIVE